MFYHITNCIKVHVIYPIYKAITTIRLFMILYRNACEIKMNYCVQHNRCVSSTHSPFSKVLQNMGALYNLDALQPGCEKSIC